MRDAGEPLSPQASGVGYGNSGTFLPGQVVYADPAAGSTEQQLLYQAIGAANLRVWADTDAAGARRAKQLTASSAYGTVPG